MDIGSPLTTDMYVLLTEARSIDSVTTPAGLGNDVGSAFGDLLMGLPHSVL